MCLVSLEIERKFLLANDTWRAAVARSSWMRQGYLRADAMCTARVRVEAGDDAPLRAWLTIKGPREGIGRPEFEYAIPPADALQMLETMCPAPQIEKTRHIVQHAGHTWEIDEFAGENAGLVLAELELARADEAYARPAWLGKEVTDDTRYYNSFLQRNPFTRWR
jgi:adenylate cyclase